MTSAMGDRYIIGPDFAHCGDPGKAWLDEGGLKRMLVARRG